MKRGPTGHYVITSTVGNERVKAFVPAPLPPKPALSIDSRLRERLDQALLSVGRLDSVTTLLPDTHLFLYMYVRKEAVLSSQIEGTQSSLSDLLLYEAEEAPGVPLDDVREVSNYVAAMEYGLKRINGGFPLSNRLIREIHGILLAKGRGATKSQGEFRTSQNWLGGSRPGNASFVPPPPELVMNCMGTLEQWLHDKPEPTSTLLKAALAHVQFETIHPFLDGNGRVGRLLVTLLFCAEKALRDPLLYLSLYLKRNRDTYYAHLSSVRKQGDWEAWIRFFADGVVESASAAVETAQRLVKTARDDRDRIHSLGRGAGTALRVHHFLQEKPIANSSTIVRKTGKSLPSVLNALQSLQTLGIVHEITGRKRNRVFSYSGYMKILSEGTEPL